MYVYISFGLVCSRNRGEGGVRRRGNKDREAGWITVGILELCTSFKFPVRWRHDGMVRYR